MCGLGAIATILGMAALVKNFRSQPASFVAIVSAIVATMVVTYLCLAYAGQLIG
jgi:multiple antibiotic resistance protein